jgi:Dyp-type peroxidase family
MTQNATDRTPSRSLHAVTELTVLAPLKRGPVAAMDTRSHETRLVSVMRTLDAFRVASVEIEPTPLIRDVIEQIRGIHSFRLAVVGDALRRQLLLTVSFDGGWEPYLRRIWRDLGPFLDLLFCNCEGYPLSRRSDFRTYARWVRQAQVPTEFFFHWGAATVNDLVTVFARPADERPPQGPLGTPQDRLAQSLPALTALYRLTELHPPAALLTQPGLGTLPQDDGATLLHAAHKLLPGLAGLDAAAIRQALRRDATPTEAAALAWWQGTVPDDRKPTPDAVASLAELRPRLQGGIVDPLDGVRQAALLLVSLDAPGAASQLLKWLIGPERRLATGEQPYPPPAAGGVFWTVAFTATGLQRLGLDEGQLDELPEEFMEGMAARASVLGDVLHNHPRHWRLPLACRPDGTAAPGAERIELAGVHAVLQLSKPGGALRPWGEATEPEHPLHPFIQRFVQATRAAGVRLLAVQTLRRVPHPQDQRTPRGHFGFADGLSQPVVTVPSPVPVKQGPWSDAVPAGDLLLGHPNSLGDKPLQGRLWQDGSFLVVRRLRQDLRAYRRALDAAVAALPPGLGLTPDGLAELMMGRRHDGASLMPLPSAPAASSPLTNPRNDFDYRTDSLGVTCPWQSHARRANPRTPRGVPGDDTTMPRLMRRGMSWGPGPDEAADDADRGLMFMAYNASLAEQFEVIQNWLAGGNSSDPRLPSRAGDPFLAVRRTDEPACFRFRVGVAAQVGPAFEEHEVSLGHAPFTVLEWGMYLFAPSVQGLQELWRVAEAAQREQPAAQDTAPTPERRAALDRDSRRLAAMGQQVIAGLERAQQLLGLSPQAALHEWKLLLEDPGARRRGLPQAVWAAVRATPGGVRRTPFGVLVAQADRVIEVFEDRLRRYTVAGYQARMERSFGPIYLGMDAGPGYDREAEPVNRAIMGVTQDDAYAAAQAVMSALLQALRPPAGAPRPDTVVDVRDLVDGLLTGLSRHWFGLPDGTHVEEGGWHWREPPPRCPGHFHTPSRYLFQPHPGHEAAAVGQAHGQQLRAAVAAWVSQHAAQPAALGTLGAAIHAALWRQAPNPQAAADLVGRTLVGVMMGFLPTVDGNLRGALFDWLDDGRFWALRRELAPFGPQPTLAEAEPVLRRPLARALQSRPVPDTVWRTVVQAHTLGEVALQPGELLVVGIGSALHERQLDDDDGLTELFGGDRSAPAPAGMPLHACPGQAMAMGVLMGALAALMATPGLRPGPSPALLMLDAQEPEPAARAT